MGRRVIALAIAGVIALVGVIMLFMSIRQADNRALAGQDPKTVFVTVRPVAAGTSLEAALADKLIEQTQVAAKALPLGALDKVDDANKKLVAVTDINPGEFILAGRFGDTKAAVKALAVPSGQVGVSMKLTRPAGVNTFLTPGSEIMLFSTYELQPTAGGNSTNSGDWKPKESRILLEKVTVIGIDSVSNAPATSTAGPTAAPDSGTDSVIVTVSISPNDAVRLVEAIDTTTLYAALRGEGAQGDVNYVVSNLAAGPASVPLFPAR